MHELSRTGPAALPSEAPTDHLDGSPGEGQERLVGRRLGRRSLVLVGLMGAGKSTIGRRLAAKLDLPFYDADHEIETAAGMSISDIFQNYGEEYFRDGERRVIARLLQERPMVLATGGGAFMNGETRARIAQSAVSIWLRADLSVLMRRVRKRFNRPLLENDDPEGTMRRLIEVRHPVYAQADLTIESHEAPHDRVVNDVLEALARWLDAGGVGSPPERPVTHHPEARHREPRR